MNPGLICFLSRVSELSLRYLNSHIHGVRYRYDCLETLAFYTYSAQSYATTFPRTSDGRKTTDIATISHLTKDEHRLFEVPVRTLAHNYHFQWLIWFFCMRWFTCAFQTMRRNILRGGELDGDLESYAVSFYNDMQTVLFLSFQFLTYFCHDLVRLRVFSFYHILIGWLFSCSWSGQALRDGSAHSLANATTVLPAPPSVATAGTLPESAFTFQARPGPGGIDPEVGTKRSFDATQSIVPPVTFTLVLSHLFSQRVFFFLFFSTRNSIFDILWMTFFRLFLNLFLFPERTFYSLMNGCGNQVAYVKIEADLPLKRSASAPSTANTATSATAAAAGTKDESMPDAAAPTSSMVAPTTAAATTAAVTVSRDAQAQKEEGKGVITFEVIQNGTGPTMADALENCTRLITLKVSLRPSLPFFTFRYLPCFRPCFLSTLLVSQNVPLPPPSPIHLSYFFVCIPDFISFCCCCCCCCCCRCSCNHCAEHFLSSIAQDAQGVHCSVGLGPQAPVLVHPQVWPRHWRHLHSPLSLAAIRRNRFLCHHVQRTSSGMRK